MDNLSVTLKRTTDDKMFVRHKDDLKKWHPIENLSLPQLSDDSDEKEIHTATTNPPVVERQESSAIEDESHAPNGVEMAPKRNP